MRFLRAIIGVTRADRLQHIKIREDTFTPESIRDLIRHKGLSWFGHVCRMQRYNIVRRAYKQDFRGQWKRGRPLNKWSDQIRNDTGLPLLTAERHAINRTEWRVQLHGAQRGVIVAYVLSQVSQVKKSN